MRPYSVIITEMNLISCRVENEAEDQPPADHPQPFGVNLAQHPPNQFNRHGFK